MMIRYLSERAKRLGSQAAGRGLVVRIAVGALAFGLASPKLHAQDDFVNYEVGQVNPMAIVELPLGQTVAKVLLVCNTPNDALEVYDAEFPYTFLTSIPTGIAPVTVRWDEITGLAYTCNHIGDSVSVIDLAASLGGTSQLVVDGTLTRTVNVGDEPSDILFLPRSSFAPGESEVVISLRSRSAVTIRKASDLSEIEARHVPFASGNVPLLNGDGIVGLKHPHMLRMVGDRQLMILDRSSDSQSAGMDLFAADITMETGLAGNPLTHPNVIKHAVKGMGTTHFDMALDSSGTHMFVVGSSSQHEQLTTEAASRAAQTGFVQSWMWVLDVNSGVTAPAVHAEGLTSSVVLPSFNLNRDYSQSGLVERSTNTLVSQPTGIALLEDNGVLSKIVITAFNSNRVIVLSPQPGTAPGWSLSTVNLSVENQASGQDGYSIAGPRSVVIDADLQEPGSQGPTGLAFVSNSLDNSVSVINPHTATEFHRFQLQHDPTPDAVRAGREFLYAARHSGTVDPVNPDFDVLGAVSCASCHIDGHTDGLPWDLSVTVSDTAIPAGFLEFAGTDSGDSMGNFPATKGRLTTQTLRGLVNSDIGGDGQAIATNAPYHWRGDKFEFTDFQGAFENLMDRSPALPDPDMDAYELFVETIHHSPNPEEALDRRISGDAGNLERLHNGSGVMLGLKAYHVGMALGASTCIHCHATPEGSNNRGTEKGQSAPLIAGLPPFLAPTNKHPFETGALRHIFDREAVVRTDDSLPQDLVNNVWTKRSGLFHNGILAEDTMVDGSTLLHSKKATINDFSYRFFGGASNSPVTPDSRRAEVRESVTAFVRQLDTGTAPMIGQAYTFIGGQNGRNTTATLAFIDQVEEANAGLVAMVSASGSQSGWWYDLEQGQFVLESVGTVNDLSYFLTQASLTGVFVTMQAVPIGSARRYASVGSTATALTGPDPSGVSILPMAPATHWERAGNFRGSFLTGVGPSTGSARVLLLLQEAVLNLSPGDTYGLTVLKHHPPRRFRVSGDDIRHGARLILTMPGESGPVQASMPLFPTKYVDVGQRTVWETSTEVGAEMTLALLNGGPFNSLVDQLRMDPDNPTPPALDPGNDNRYGVQVINEIGSASALALGPLTIQDVR